MAQAPELKPQPSAASKLRAMLAEKGKIVVGPGVYDGFTARMALNAGYDCLYMTGAGTTMSRLGTADLGLATMTEMASNASTIAQIDPAIPLIADADTGYGGALNVARTVHHYILGGVAALHLEDQVVTKRCGHLANKAVVSVAEFASRIRAAAATRAKLGRDIVIIARTDALASEGLEEALARMQAAVRAGADVAFVEGIRSEEEAAEIVRRMAPTPCLFNVVPGGVSPNLSVARAREIGFGIIIFPILALGAVYRSFNRALEGIREHGTSGGEGVEEAPVRELFESCGLKEFVEFDVEMGGGLYKQGV